MDSYVKNYQVNSLVANQTTLDIYVLMRICRKAGLSYEDVLQGTGLDRHSISQKSSLISMVQKIRVLANIEHWLPDKEVGLLLGQKFNLTDFGLWGFLILNSRTPREGIMAGLEYISLVSPMLHFKAVINQDIGYFEVVETYDLGKHKTFYIEFWFSAIAHFASSIWLGRCFPSTKLSFCYEEPSHAHRYREIFGCEVEFGAKKTIWSFDITSFDEESAMHNPIALQMCRESCDSYRHHIMSIDSKRIDLEKYLETVFIEQGYFPNIEQVADSMNLSTRQLRRNLELEGVSYSSTLADIRCSYAKQYLDESRLSIGEIARLIGYSDASNFRQAFKRWTNQTPSYYRQTLVRAT